MTTIDDEWKNFINFGSEELDPISEKPVPLVNDIPQPTDIYISTKSKIAFLNKPINLEIFWEIPIISYFIPKEGIIKKQIKINSKSLEEVDILEKKLNCNNVIDVQVINKIHNPTNRTKFKDIRKISIGLCKKDILSYRCKKKQAFYNCFVLILRLLVDSEYKEYHVKIFNTGKLEIPGVQNEKVFQNILNFVLELFKKHTKDINLAFNSESETVLINSNFNCGFYINRESLFQILTKKYGIHAIYDACSYPGVQCKFYYDDSKIVQNGRFASTSPDSKGISFMIFRTGSVLIVGKCEEKVLFEIYDYLKNLLIEEYQNIVQKINNEDLVTKLDDKNKNKKIRKKTILINY